MRDERWVVLVADDDAGDAFGAAVGVEGVCCRGRGGVRGGFGCLWVEGGGGRREGGVHFSSMSCRWPGLVRSATVLLKRVMNSP